jgi:hypothetical protein
MNDIQLKYDAHSTRLLEDTLRALNDHVHGLTQPATLEQHPWIRNLYYARRDHKFNKLIAEHDRLNAVVRSLFKSKDDDPNSTQALWHANSKSFFLPKGMYALPTRSKQLEQGKQEQHCCGLYTWNAEHSLVFGMKSPDTGATATLEIHIPTQEVRQFYGPHNSSVSDHSLIFMAGEFLAKNRELMTRLTEQLRTKALR